MLKTWDEVDCPATDEHEDATTVRLFSAMVKAKDQKSTHSFLIRYQDVEVDFDLEKETPKGHRLFPAVQRRGDIFRLKAKRLNVIKDGKRRALADEYVKEGMQRFIDRKYSRKICHGGMLGYVLDGDIGRAMTNVSGNIRANHQSLRMEPPGDWAASSIRPSDRAQKNHGIRRAEPTAPISLHHLFVEGCTRFRHPRAGKINWLEKVLRISMSNQCV